jgi:hypothetical protein
LSTSRPILLTIASCSALFLFSGFLIAQEKTEADRKARVEQCDKKHVRYSTGMSTDTAKDFLKIPEYYNGKVDFDVAKAAPEVDFAPVRGLNPEFFPEDNKGLWSQWAEVTRGPNGRFYMATGDHRCKDGRVFITEYDPAARDQRIVVDVGKTCGWRQGQYVDGKIHGRMDIMPDGTLVAATWNGSTIQKDWIDHGYVKGGHLLTYNVFTGETVYHGVPFYGDSWPYHVTDTQTGVFMAIGAEGYFIAYDVRKRKLLYGGMPPDGIKWNERSTLLDERTGLLYSTDKSTADQTFICYDQRSNSFRRLACKVPPSPATGKVSQLRAYTEVRTPDNFFYCMDWAGTFFKFWPDEERTEAVGINWDKEGVYTTSLDISPRFRYVYYVPASHGESWKWGAPVIQYDTKTNRRKVIAFLEKFYQETYGYCIGGTYGIELSADGSLLVIQMNGSFGPEATRFEQPAIFAVHIPESERME